MAVVNARNAKLSVIDLGGLVRLGIEVGNVASNIIVLSYLEALDATSVPAITDFVTTPARTISNVQITGNECRLTVDSNFLNTDTITLSYTVGVNPIQNLAGDAQEQSFTDEPVTNNISGGGYTATAQAIFARMPVALTTTEMDAIDTYIRAESSVEGGNGNYEKRDEIYCHALTDIQNKLTGWKSKTATNNGAIAASGGLDFGSGNNYIDYNFAPATDGVQFQLNDAGWAMLVWENRETGGTNSFFGANADQTYLRITSTIQGACSQSLGSRLGDVEVNIQDKEYCAMRRTSANDVTTVLETKELSSTNASGTFTTNSLYGGARNANGTPVEHVDAIIGWFSIGAGIGFDDLAHRNNVRQLFTDLGLSF